MNVIRYLLALAWVYCVALILGFVIYVALIRSPLFAELNILFYRGTIIAVIAALVLAAALAAAAKYWRSIDVPTAVGAVVLSLSFNICFLVIFPVTIDRSVTVFLLSRMEQLDRPVSTQELQRIFEKEYIQEMRQIERRVDEQSLSGNIVRSSNGITLTPNGRRFLNSSRTIGRWFDTDPRFTDTGDEAKSVR
jgi:Zn-dependent protease with chaperone function